MNNDVLNDYAKRLRKAEYDEVWMKEFEDGES